MKCRKGHDINLARQVLEWEKDYGEDMSVEGAMLMIECEECEAQVAVLYVDPADEFEEVDSPLGPVEMPKFDIKEPPCLHDGCQECGGTGVKRNGKEMCVHMISCPCPKCTATM
jgi:hypothetical protein